MKKVVKFGGSSLADSEQFKKVGEIIKSDPSRVYVIPSAPGKRFSGDEKVTDLLYKMHYKASKDEDFGEELEKIRERYNEIIEGLGLEGFSLEGEFAQIERRMHQSPDSNYAASRGEYLNGRIMARYLGYEFIDAKDVIFFDEHGNLDADKTNEVMSERLAKTPKAVIPGFYGRGFDGHVKTFSRGGSDITGSIVARACKSDVYENWTDVSGFMVADPRIINNPVGIETITYRELRELSYMGASVLHEDAIFPVRHEGIPINIRNTNRPDDDGTWIVESTCQKSGYVITGIAGKKGFCTVLINKALMNSEVGFGRKVLQAFEESGISFEHMPSGIDTMTIVVHEDEFKHAQVNVRMIDQGSSELNIIIGVNNEDFETAVRAIYDIFVKTRI